MPHDFPGYAQNKRNPDNPRPFVEALEAAFLNDMPDTRFDTCLQLHEFETFFFADPDALRIAYDQIDSAVTELRGVAEKVGDLETINDSPETAPSKRVIQEIPAYEDDKPTVGPDVAEYIGMQRLISACPHFGDWIEPTLRVLHN